MFAPGSRACAYKSASGLAEWPNQDPIGERGGINLYAYVGNNPINIVDLYGLWGDGQNAMWNEGGYYILSSPRNGPSRYHAYTEDEIARTPRGHSDLPNVEDPSNPGHNAFDWTAEDHGWSNPFNPFSTWRHFQPLSASENDLQSAIDKCDRDAFERAMHRMEDYYSHYRPGYRWYTGGHAYAGTEPDDSNKHSGAYDEAGTKTQDWLNRFLANCKQCNGKWVKK